MNGVHGCPGCAVPGVPDHLLACGPCWGRLPRVYRNAVLAAWRNRSKAPLGHLRAVGAARTWYRQNPDA
jgi:hypothetical protein